MPAPLICESVHETYGHGLTLEPIPVDYGRLPRKRQIKLTREGTITGILTRLRLRTNTVRRTELSA